MTKRDLSRTCPHAADKLVACWEIDCQSCPIAELARRVAGLDEPQESMR